MKNKLLFMLLILSNYVFADTKQDEHVHQYIVREAYKLIKYQLGYDIFTGSVKYL